MAVVFRDLGDLRVCHWPVSHPADKSGLVGSRGPGNDLELTPGDQGS